MKTKKFKFNYRGENMELDVEVCDNVFSQANGLMFRNDGKALLFIFSNSKLRAIHSFFCKPFFAIWFDKMHVIDDKLVDKWKPSIYPSEKFDMLLEIPARNKMFGEISRRRNL